jgi:hypothetical protein
MGKGFQSQDRRANVTLVGDPSIVRRELLVVPNKRFNHVLCAANLHYVASRNEYFLSDFAARVPLLGELYRPICHFEVGDEEFRLHFSVVRLEGLAHGLLLVSISSHICACVGDSEGAFAKHLAFVDTHVRGCQVRS